MRDCIDTRLIDTPPAGLTRAEALGRLAAEGPNTLPREQRHGLAALVLGVLREPMFLLLIGAGAVYLVLGDLREALVLAASVVVVIAITVIQERRTERAVEALRDLSSPRALVIRDGIEARIAGADVVRGDLLRLREGDRVAADADLVETHGLAVDESLLTGESVPVDKEAAPGAPARVFSGTLVVRGTALAQVVATGARAEIGRIGASLASVDSGKTALEVETARMVRLLAAIALALCVASALLYYALRGDPLAALLSGLTLAMALLPEEFPVVLTVFLALGAWRIAARGVLTRRLPAIEMLGAATVLCTDKTGTLTENRMTLVETWTRDGWRAPGGDAPGEQALLEAAARACEPAPFDPMERALVRDIAGAGVLEHRYPMAAGFLAVCHGWRRDDGTRVAAIKGAPETVLAACRLPEAQRDIARAAVAEAAARGLRILGVGSAPWESPEWPDSTSALDFGFLGFVALADPVRANVPEAIALCRRAGIRVVMITGDHPGTARAIAAQSGIDAGTVLTGPELEAMDGAALTAAAARVQVFARVRPEQKLALVNALRAAGEVVAMTGDGVNDAPALKAAHIGIAMGKRGTDVAREASALVLLEDDFTSIVAAVALGRRINDNIRNAMRFLLAVHVPLAGMSMLPLLMGWPLFVHPVHVVFLEFVIDPACSIVFEAERADSRAMDRPPRAPGEPLFTPRSIAIGFLLGAGVLAAVALVYGWALGIAPEGEARAAAFATLVAGDLGLILANRSRHLTLVGSLALPNRALWWIVAATATALAVVIYLPAAAAIFRFAPPGPGLLLASVAAGLASVLWYDAYKRLRPRP